VIVLERIVRVVNRSVVALDLLGLPGRVPWSRMQASEVEDTGLGGDFDRFDERGDAQV
jgi:hypothetical protein